jgi:hypothetical protein
LKVINGISELPEECTLSAFGIFSTYACQCWCPHFEIGNLGVQCLSFKQCGRGFALRGRFLLDLKKSLIKDFLGTHGVYVGDIMVCY